MKTLKHIFGAAVLGADILLGIAARGVFRGLHHETASHQQGTLAVYGVAALLTLWVIVSVIRGVQDKAGKPAARPSYFGQPPRTGRR